MSDDRSVHWPGCALRLRFHAATTPLPVCGPHYKAGIKFWPPTELGGQLGPPRLWPNPPLFLFADACDGCFFIHHAFGDVSELLIGAAFLI